MPSSCGSGCASATCQSGSRRHAVDPLTAQSPAPAPAAIRASRRSASRRQRPACRRGALFGSWGPPFTMASRFAHGPWQLKGRLGEKEVGRRSGTPRATAPLFELRLDLPPPGSREASRSLYEQLKAAILEGRLPAGARLPGTRRSEAFLGVSRNTAAAVY